MSQAYPLQWPAGWPRTDAGRREHARFKTSLDSALALLQKQLGLMGAKNIVLSSNYTLGASNPQDPGVVAYFDWSDKPYAQQPDVIPMSIPCDRWTRIEANVQAIALTVEAMRGMERWGAKHMIRAMFAGFKRLPESTTEPWADILGISPSATPSQIESRYKELAKRHHPDVGGNHDDFVRIQSAYDRALASK